MNDLITDDMVEVPFLPHERLMEEHDRRNDPKYYRAMALDKKTLVAVQMSDDGADIGVRRSDWLIIDPRNILPCDSLYILKTREVVRAFILGRNEVVFKHANGGPEVTHTMAEAKEMVAGWVLYTCREVHHIDDCDRQKRSQVPQGR